MGNVKIGTVELGTVPRIVAVVDDVIPIEVLHGYREKGAALFELRFDLFTADFNSTIRYVEHVRNSLNAPFIGTLRETEENRIKRMSLFERIIPLIDSVDIEIDADINRKVIEKAKGKTIIVSEHDFEKTPSVDVMSQIVETAIDIGADIVKIAAMAESQEDVSRLMDFTKSRSENMVAISMGEIGKRSRIEGFKSGSLFTYAFITEEVAPGQISLDEMVEEFKARYPDF